MNWLYMPPIDMEWDVDSKVRSKDNIGHVPSGGNKSIQSHPVKWKAEAKVASLDEKHMAQVEKSLSAPKKDHTRRIKIPPTIPVSNYKHVEYTRNGVYAIVEPPVKIKAKSKVDFPKQDRREAEDTRSLRPFDNDIHHRIKVTKNTKVDKYKNVEETEFGTYVILDPVKIEAKSKVDFPKAVSVPERKPSQKVDVTRRIKVTKNTRVNNYNNVEQTDDGTYVVVDPVKIEAKSKVHFPKPDPALQRKQSENVDVTRRIKVTKNTKIGNYKNVEQTDDGVYVLVDHVKIDAKSKVDFPKPDPERKESEHIDVSRRIKVTKHTRTDNYKNVEQKGDGRYIVVDRVKIAAKAKVDFPKADPSKGNDGKVSVEPVEHKFRFF